MKRIVIRSKTRSLRSLVITAPHEPYPTQQRRPHDSGGSLAATHMTPPPHVASLIPLSRGGFTPNTPYRLPSAPRTMPVKGRRAKAPHANTRTGITVTNVAISLARFARSNYPHAHPAPLGAPAVLLRAGAGFFYAPSVAVSSLLACSLSK